MSEEIKVECNDVLGSDEAELLVEYTTREEYIGCAFNAIMAVTDMDTGLLNKVEQNRVRRIRRMCLRILDDCVKEMHDELFETEED